MKLLGAPAARIVGIVQSHLMLTESRWYRALERVAIFRGAICPATHVNLATGHVRKLNIMIAAPIARVSLQLKRRS